MAEQPKHLNLQGLLRFALEATKSEDASGSSTFDQMNEENKRFLESALKAMTVDIIEEFEKALGILNSSSSVLDKINALNIIREYIDNIDFANNFLKVGGGEVILKQLNENDLQIKTASAYIVAEMSQNNPFSQKYFVDANTVPLLLSYLNESEDLANSALHAISALIRNYEPGLLVFLEHGGINSLLSLLNINRPRVFTKICFLIATLSTSHDVIRDAFINKSAVSILITFLEPAIGFDVKIEAILFALAALSESGKWEIMPEQLENLYYVLNNIIVRNENMPECEEMICYTNRILEKIKGSEREM